MQLRPQELFPIVYNLADPNDTGIYFVRAVIRNSATGAIVPINGVNYVNLTVSATNSRRFSASIQTPQDSSGVGFFIDVTITVYTDSGYTTVASTYQERMDTHLVEQRWNQTLEGGGTGGWTSDKLSESVGSAIDYEKIAELLKIKLEKMLNGKDKNNVKKIEIEALTELVQEVHASVKEIKPFDESKLSDHGEKVIKALSAHIEKHKPDPTNLSPILEALEGLEIPTPPTPEEIAESIIPHFEAVHEKVDSLVQGMPDFDYMSRVAEIADIAGKLAGKSPIKEAGPKSSERAKKLL